MNMIRKEQINGVEKGDIQSQVERLRVVGVSNFWSCCVSVS